MKGFLVIILVVTLILTLYIRISKKYYGICPKCGKEFNASPLQLICTIHAFNDFYLKCPNCGDRGFKKFKKRNKQIL